MNPFLSLLAFWPSDGQPSDRLTPRTALFGTVHYRAVPFVSVRVRVFYALGRPLGFTAVEICCACLASRPWIMFIRRTSLLARRAASLKGEAEAEALLART